MGGAGAAGNVASLDAVGVGDAALAPSALLRSLFLRSRGVLALAVALGAVGGALGAGLIALINYVQQPGSAALAEWVTWLFVAVLIGRLSSALTSKMLLVRSGQQVVKQVRAFLARRLLSASLPSLEALGAHRVTTALTTDVSNIALLFTNLPTLCVNAAIVVGCLVYIGFISSSLLAMTLIVIGAGIAVHQALSRRAMRRLGRARSSENVLFKHLATLSGGFKELKMDGAKAAFVLERLIEGAAEDYRRENVGAYDAFAVAEAWTGLLLFVPFGLVLFSGLPWLPADSSLIHAYVLTLLFLVAPLSAVVGLVPLIGAATVSSRSIESMQGSLDTVDVVPDCSAPLLRPGAWHRLTFEGITFSYAGTDGFGVGPIDLTLQPGEIVFFVGGNGSGKSTFVKLMAGLYPALRGRICVNGVPLRAEQRAAYRGSFSTIFADFSLFPELPVALDEAALHRADEYLKLLGLDGRVSIEGGRFSRVDLSTGQRKRLAMVSALLEERAILVLDEWAAEQDAEARALFYERILPKLRARGITVVAVTHDDRFFSCADRVIRFDYGRVTEPARPRAARPAAMNSSAAASRGQALPMPEEGR